MDGAQVHGNTNLELAWTVAPVLILVAIGSFIFYKLPGIEDVPAADRTEVAVEGHRYYWNFIYPNGVIAVDTAARARRADDAARGVGARLRRHPLLVDPRARRQVRRDPRTRQRDLVQRRMRPGSTAASAPSSAAPSTR